MDDFANMSIYLVLQKLTHICSFQTMNRMKQVELKPGQAGILFTLHHYGALSQRSLADRVHITPPSMTVALRKLEERGLVSREPDSSDKRIFLVKITPVGEELINKIQTITGELEDELCFGMSDEERIIFRRLLIQAYQNMIRSGEFRDMDMRQMMREMHRHMEHSADERRHHGQRRQREVTHE